ELGEMLVRTAPQRDCVAFVRQHLRQRRAPASGADDRDLHCGPPFGDAYDNRVRVVPLGGCGEFGRNLTVYEAEGRLLCVDCGGQIPDDEAPGVDLWIPDFTWLAARPGDVVAWVLTHAHEDHIAALPHALGVAPAPVYARPLTLALLRGSI